MKWGVVFLVLLVSAGIMLQQAEAMEPGDSQPRRANYHLADEIQEKPLIVRGGKGKGGGGGGGGVGGWGGGWGGGGVIDKLRDGFWSTHFVI